MERFRGRVGEERLELVDGDLAGADGERARNAGVIR